MKKKNELYLIYGGIVNEDEDYNVTYEEYFTDLYVTFKNKDKAENYIEELIDKYMKRKSYSLNYEIIEPYIDKNQAIKTFIYDIRDKNDYTVFRVEMKVIDLSKVIM